MSPRFTPLLFGTALATVLLSTPTLAQEVIDAPYFVTWSAAAVREAPDTESGRMATLAFGDQVFVTGTEGDWFSVELGETGERGWVWSGVLAPMRIALPGEGGSGAAMADNASGFTASDDNSFDLAQYIEVDESGVFLSGSVGDHDSTDYYYFDLFDWTDLQIDLYNLQTDVDIALYDIDRNFLADSLNSGTDPEFIDSLLEPGGYYLEVYPFEGSSEYSLEIFAFSTSEPAPDAAGDSQDTAFELGTLVSGEALYHSDTVGASDQTDYLAFSITERTELFIEVYGMTSDVDLTIEDDFGSVIGSSSNAGTDAEFVELVLEPGTYYLVLVPYSGTSSYEVSISGQAATPAPTDEGGNGFDDAVSLGTLASGGTPLTMTEQVGNGDRADYYSFSIEEAGSVSVSLTPFTDDADLRLYSDGGTTFIASSEAASTDQELITQDLEAGTYIIEVSIFGQQTEYELSVSRP